MWAKICQFTFACFLIWILFYKIIPWGSKDDLEERDTIFDGSALVRDGIYWSALAESYVPKGLSFEETNRIINNYKGKVVKDINQQEIGDRNSSKRRNVLITYEDQTVFYVKHRSSRNAYAEVLYFYISRLLSMDNVPPVFMTTSNNESEVWKEVDVSNYDWADNRIMTVIYWINDVSKLTSVPLLIKNAVATGEPITRHSLTRSATGNYNTTYIGEVLQFGTLLIMDYIAVHYDRYKHINDMGIGNIFESSNGKIWSIDNEGSFRCLTSQAPRCVKVYRDYERLVKAMCIFETSIVSSLRHISEHLKIHNALLNYQTVNMRVPWDKNASLSKLIAQRIDTVNRWIKHCQTLS